MQESQLLLSSMCIHFKSGQLHTQADTHQAPDTVAAYTSDTTQHLGAFVQPHPHHPLASPTGHCGLTITESPALSGDNAIWQASVQSEVQKDGQ